MAETLAHCPETEGERLAVTVCATDKYQYAMTAQARAIHANLRDLRIPIEIVLIGDDGLKEIEKLYRSLFALGIDAGRVTIDRVAGFNSVKGENYKNAAQLLIAQMRTAAFERARAWGATLCWSLDSDVIPKSSMCFKTLRWILDIPGQFYEVAISPYPSQGGGDMLTGRGTPENPILQDFTKEERKIPEDLAARMKANREAIEAAVKATGSPAKEMIEEAGAINKAVSECPPIGNVFEMNAKNGWRRRGWLSAAYPGMGRGVIVPTDWCGFGSTLMNRRALDECDFLGYDGSGTEDLFIVWNRWHQAGIRIASALHEPSSHVSRRADGKFFVSSVRFVTEADESKGECVGHVRTIQRPFYAQDRGERYDPANDGIPIPPDKRTPVAPAMPAEISPPAPMVPEVPSTPSTSSSSPKTAEPPTTLITRGRKGK